VLTPIADTHFAKDLSKDSPNIKSVSRSSVYLLISIVVGLLAGAYPSYYVTSFPPALVLKGSFGLSPKGRVLRTSLICLQFVVSFMLVIGVGIMYLQSYLIFHTDYGFDKDEVMVVPTAPDTRNHAATCWASTGSKASPSAPPSRPCCS